MSDDARLRGASPETPGALKRLLDERGLAPNRRFGQNFLIEAGLLDAIAKAAELDRTDLCLEIGTGTASLTRRLADGAGHVVSVEIDRGLFALAAELLAEKKNVSLVHADVMKTKTTLEPLVVDEVNRRSATPDIERFKIVANLPYNISTPFLATAFQVFGAPAKVVLLVQKELGEGMAAAPSTDAYGHLSVLTAMLGKTTIVRRVPREVFFPRPDVESAVVAFTPHHEIPIETVRAVYPLVQFLFGERRKTIGALLKKIPDHIFAGEVRDILPKALESAGLTGMERAEQLAARSFISLARGLGISGADR